MSSLIIRPGTVEDVDQVQPIANEPKSTLPYLGGWTMREQLVGLYSRGNTSVPYNIVAEIDGKVVGFSDSKPKHNHYHEYDLVAVLPELRRQRISSAMYAYHALRCGLSGRMFARDQTIHFNEVMGKGYLPFHGFEKQVELRSKVRNFSSLLWWTKDFSVDSIDEFTQRVEKDEVSAYDMVEYRLQDSEALKSNFDIVCRLLEERSRFADLERIKENREHVLKMVSK